MRLYLSISLRKTLTSIFVNLHSCFDTDCCIESHNFFSQYPWVITRSKSRSHISQPNVGSLLCSPNLVIKISSIFFEMEAPISQVGASFPCIIADNWRGVL